MAAALKIEYAETPVRQYDPETGRWVSKDALSFGGGSTNLYSYAIDDPVNLVDPSGNIVIDKTGGKIPAEVRDSVLYRELDQSPQLITIEINDQISGFGQTTLHNDGSLTIDINQSLHSQYSANELVDTYIHELNHAQSLIISSTPSEFIDTQLLLPLQLNRNFGPNGIQGGQCPPH